MAFWPTSRQRPKTVVWFEALSILVLVGDIVASVEARYPTWLIILFVLLTLWLVLSISRLRSNVARWALTVFLAAFILAFFYDLVAYGNGVFNLAEVPVIDWLVGLGTMLQLWLLWSADTGRWIVSRRPPEEAAV